MARKYDPVLAFDIYGTLLDTGSIGAALSEHAHLSPETATQLSLTWRKYQLEYTWRMNSMQVYEPFDVVTRQSLQHAASEHKIHLTDETVNALIQSYNALRSFPNAEQVLAKLDDIKIKTIVFSNGSPQMISAALENANLQNREIFSVDSIKLYKPAKEVYEGLLRQVGKQESPEECWLVSGNPFDVCGARNSGMSAIWVDRAGAGWQDALGGLRPTVIVKDLDEIASAISSAALGE